MEEGSPGKGDLRTGAGLPEQGGAIDCVEYLEEGNQSTSLIDYSTELAYVVIVASASGR